MTSEKGSGPSFSKNSTIVDQSRLWLFEKGAKKPDQTRPEGTMKGWSTEEAAMGEDCGVLKATGLSSLFKDKPDIALDTLLKRLGNYN